MVYNIKYRIDCEESFVRYIYGDIRDELKNLWKTMLTLLGMLGVALGYLFKGTNIIPSLWEYLIAAQLLWLFAMIEILLFSNYISKHKFLMEIEKGFDPTLKDNSHKMPFWQTWVSEDSFSSYNGYTIPVVCITIWSFLAFLGAAIKAFAEGICKKDDLGIALVVIIIAIEFLAAFWASRKTYSAYQDARADKRDNPNK
jgi:hypothetical protein